MYIKVLARPKPDQASRQRGAAIVEMAVVLPILVTLVFGIIEFSIAFNRLQGLHAAAREGARTASIPTSTYSDVDARVTSALTGITFDTGPSAPTVSPGGCACL